MKRLAVLAVILSLAFIIPALGNDARSRPDGVSAEEWVAISDNLGLVVVSQYPPKGTGVIADRTLLLVTPPINGYFMVRRGGKWQRLVVLEPVRG